MKDRTVRRLSALHRAIFRWSSGKIGRRLVNNDMLLLTTTGTRTGQSHTVPLLYLRDGDSLVVVASYGGRPRSPQWHRNLMATGEGTVQIDGDVFAVEARVAEGEERSRLWDSITTAYGGYSVYQSKTSREIPVVILSSSNDQS